MEGWLGEQKGSGILFFERGLFGIKKSNISLSGVKFSSTR